MSLLKILSKFYEYSINRINKGYDDKRIEIFKPNTPVISIGNLSIGGTGKTPFVISLGKFLKSTGIKFGVIGKGYKRKSSGELLVSDGYELFVQPEKAGDEMFLIAQQLNVPVVVHDEKYLAAKTLDDNFILDCIIVDDGFQHRKLHRDIDIVLIDVRTLSNPFLIPKGRLREPIESLNRADVVCFMDTGDNSNIDILKKFDNKLIIICKKILSVVYNLFDGNVKALNPKDSFLAVSGIGNPYSFLSLLKLHSFNIIDKLNFIDHHKYSANSIKHIISKCNKNQINSIITTDKDAIKLKNFGEIFAKYNIDCYVASIEVKFENNEQLFFDYILNKLKR